MSNTTTTVINGLKYYIDLDKNNAILYGTDGLKRPVRNLPAEIEHHGKKYPVCAVYNGRKSCGGYYSGAFRKDEVITSVSFPETLREISDLGGSYLGGTINDYHYGAFACCLNLKDVVLSNSIKVIGEYAFYNCEKIQEFYFGDELESICEAAFMDCSSLEHVFFNDKIKKIGNSAFYRCGKLSNVSFPDSIEEIGPHSFRYCCSMTEVNIPASVKKIESMAFGDSGVKVVNIYSEDINIAADAFPADAQINFLDKNSYPKHQRRRRGDKKAEPVQNAQVKEGKPVEEKPQDAKPQTIDLDTLIAAVVSDGVITEKEREVLLKKATAAGMDADEVEILLDAKLAQTKKPEEPKPMKPAELKPKIEVSPTLVETPTDTDDMEFNLSKDTTVETVTSAFKNRFGSVLRIYNGQTKADSSETLGALGLSKEGQLFCRGSLTVASFIARAEEFGLKVKVYTCDEWVAVLDGLTLCQSGKVKKNAVKADMESMIAYLRNGESAPKGDYSVVKNANGSYTVSIDGVVQDNAKGAMRQIADAIGFEHDNAWTTQQFGAKLSKELGK